MIQMHKKTLGLVSDIQKIIEETGMKMTVRQIYYQLVSRHIIQNSIQEYKNYNRILTQARKEGLINPFNLIDTSKPILIPESWNNVKEFIEDVKQAYRKRVWEEQESYVEVWLEKDALRGVFYPITKKYDVPLLIGRGYQSFTNLMLSVQRLKEHSHKNIRVLYFGDFDPTGLDIPHNIRKTLSDYGIEFSFYRVAITEEQIAQYNIPPIPTKKSDPRSKQFVDRFGDNAVELDALNPKVLNKIVEESITYFLDKEKYSQIVEKEKRDLSQLHIFMEKYGGDSDE